MNLDRIGRLTIEAMNDHWPPITHEEWRKAMSAHCSVQGERLHRHSKNDSTVRLGKHIVLLLSVQTIFEWDERLLEDNLPQNHSDPERSE